CAVGPLTNFDFW
nr:immunoglobulin heavy chain junction region [Macaca mulatta]MOW22011.1 immunoglobulin heavy chain junction region [Macaca mulatta]